MLHNYFLTWPPEGIPSCREQQLQLLLSQCCVAKPPLPLVPASCQPVLGAASRVLHIVPDLREHREGEEKGVGWCEDWQLNYCFDFSLWFFIF